MNNIAIQRLQYHGGAKIATIVDQLIVNYAGFDNQVYTPYANINNNSSKYVNFMKGIYSILEHQLMVLFKPFYSVQIDGVVADYRPTIGNVSCERLPASKYWDISVEPYSVTPDTEEIIQNPAFAGSELALAFWNYVKMSKSNDGSTDLIIDVEKEDFYRALNVIGTPNDTGSLPVLLLGTPQYTATSPLAYAFIVPRYIRLSYNTVYPTNPYSHVLDEVVPVPMACAFPTTLVNQFSTTNGIDQCVLYTNDTSIPCDGKSKYKLGDIFLPIYNLLVSNSAALTSQLVGFSGGTSSLMRLSTDYQSSSTVAEDSFLPHGS
jgi:hypothetical protein